MAVDAEVERWLPRLAKFLGVDAIGVAQLSEGRTLHVVHGHAIPGAPRLPPVIRDVELPWYFEQIRQARTLAFGCLPRGLPHNATAERSYVAHLGLKSHLVLPFTAEGPMSGALLVAATRPRRWPRRVVRHLQLTADLMGGALARLRVRRALEERLGFERLISDLVKTFVSVPTEELDAKIDEGLGHFIAYFGVDRSYLVRLLPDGSLLFTHSARRAGVPPMPARATFPWYAREMMHRRVVRMAEPWEGLPAEAQEEARYVRAAGMRAHLGIPLVFAGRVWGAFGFASFREPRRWTDEEVDRLRLVGEIMMAALLRRDNDKASQRQREELAHVARVAALGELTAALAHELNQPLAAIGANAAALRRTVSLGRPPAKLDEILSDIARDAERGGALILRLRSLLKRREIEKESLDVNQVVLDVQVLLAAEARRHDARLIHRLADTAVLPRVAGDAIQLQQVVLNLVCNAAEAMTEIPLAAREIIVSSSATDPDEVVVAVQDCGPAIDQETFDAMFVPFVSTKREGLGMGLAISRSIIEAHGGRLWAERRSESGLSVQFTLPAEHSSRT